MPITTVNDRLYKTERVLRSLNAKLKLNKPQHSLYHFAHKSVGYQISNKLSERITNSLIAQQSAYK